MEFQPSQYSLQTSEYDGLKDFFSKEARQSRQAQRRDKRSARKELRKSGKKKLTQKSGAKKLWGSAYPWADRPGTGKQAVAYTLVGAMAYEKLAQPIAKGSRPPAMFQGREWRATILGGLQALSGAGVPGYPDVSHLKVGIRSSDAADAEFLRLSGNAASLKDAAEYIRAEVIQNKLQVPAWNYRALIMIQPAVLSATVRATGAGVASAIVPMPFGLIPMAISAQESVHGAVLAREVKEFTEKAAQGLEKAGVRNASQIATQQARATLKLAQADEAQMQAQADEVAAGVEQRVKLVMGVTALATVGLVAAIVIRRVRS
jgi:hypothetical protein